MEIDKNIIQIIDDSADKFNAISNHELSKVSTFIKELNGFISGTISLSHNGIEERLDYLIGYFTLTLDIQFSKKSFILRARKFEDGRDKNPCYKTTAELSYPPKNYVKLGRCNKDRESIFYGCLCGNEATGTETAFSEVRARQYERINVLRSEATEKLNLRFIGIWDHVLRDSKPYFLSDETWDLYKEVHKYMDNKFSYELFKSFLLCDAFFADIFHRKGTKKLYEVTSILSGMFLEGDKAEGGKADGILYASVENKGFPVVALSTKAVDDKLKHISAVCYEILGDYGYAQYKVKKLYDGLIDGNTIKWE